jgi:TolA-binding protein
MKRTVGNLFLFLVAACCVLILTGESQGQRFSPGPVEREYNECVELYESGAYGDARKRIEQFLAEHPHSRWSETILFLNAKIESNVPEAVRKYRRFLDDYPEGAHAPEAAFLLGELYELTDDFLNAQQCYFRVYQHFNESRFGDESAVRAAKCMLLNGDAPSVLAHLEQYLSRRPENPWEIRARELHADALFQVGEYERALEEYKRVISQAPAENSPAPQCYLQVAEIYEILGNREAAFQSYRRFLENFPHTFHRRKVEDRMRELAHLLNVDLTEETRSYLLEAGSFESESAAAELQTQLEKIGYEAYVIKKDSHPRGRYSVRMGPYATRELVDSLMDRLKDEAGLAPNALVQNGHERNH